MSLNAQTATPLRPGCAHHIIQRGNNRADCFVEDTDRPRYLESLREASTRNRVEVDAYVLLTNHVHLLVSPDTAESCGKILQSLGRRYVRRINDWYKCSGTLWEGRYKTTLVDTDADFFAVSKYIEMNPVRAGIVAAPPDYPWSSYAKNALGEHSSLVTPHKLYLGLGRELFGRQILDITERG